MLDRVTKDADEGLKLVGVTEFKGSASGCLKCSGFRRGRWNDFHLPSPISQR